MEKLIVFGRGEYFKSKYDDIKQTYELVGILDNAEKEESYDETYECKVYNPSKILQLPKYKIACMSRDFVCMWRQLLQLGVTENRIVFSPIFYPLREGLEKLAFSHGEMLYSENKQLYFQGYNKKKYIIDSYEGFMEIVRDYVKGLNADIDSIANLQLEPVSRTFGCERGYAVDRIYIDRFIEMNKQYLKGICMEVGDNRYMSKYNSAIEKQYILHVDGSGENSFKGNFETGEGLEDKKVDCLVCTQTLIYIYGLRDAIRNIYSILNPGGTALITVSGIKMISKVDDSKWGDFWSFTDKSLRKLCEDVCSRNDSYEVETFGNVKTTVAYLYGLCYEDLKETDFEFNDPQYPQIVAARITKAI